MWCLNVSNVAGEIVENAAYTGKKTTIRYAMWGGAGEVKLMRTISKGFVEQYPNIRLEVYILPHGEYFTKLQTQVAAGIAPDVLTMAGEGSGVWVGRGALLPLDKFVKESRLNLHAYHKVALQLATWDGKLYMFPYMIAEWNLVYSKDKLEQSGIPQSQWPRPDRQTSWDNFLKLTRALTLRQPDGNIRQYGLGVGTEWDDAMAMGYGGKFVDRQVNPTKPVVLEHKAELAKGLIAVFDAQYADVSMAGEKVLETGAFVSDETLVQSPMFAMSLAGPWTAREFAQQGLRFGIAPLPKMADPRTLIIANSLGIYSGSHHPEEAWKFIQYMASEKAQSIYGRQMEGVPSLKSAGKSLVHNKFGAPDCESYLYTLDHIAEPEIHAENSDVLNVLPDWQSDTEQTIFSEYQHRLLQVPRDASGAVTAKGYAAFQAHMRDFIKTTVNSDLDILAANYHRVFAAEHRGNGGMFVRVVVPILVMIAVVMGALMLYFVVAKNNASAKINPGRLSGAGAYLFLAPYGFGFLFFLLTPIVAALYLSFTNYNMVRPPGWVGAENYLTMFTSNIFWIGIRRTFAYAALAVPIALIGGLVTAGLLTCNVRGANIFKIIVYFPSLFTGAAAAVLWLNLFNYQYGVVNLILSWVGINPVNWLDQAHAFYTVLLMNFFWVGGAMIIYYASMKQIPASLYEVAKIDGAGAIRTFLSVTIPLLSPTIFFLFIVTTIAAFQVFTPALFFAPSTLTIGQPGNSLRLYSVNIYDEAFNNMKMGSACAYAMLLFVIIFCVTMVQMKIAKRFVHVESE